MDRFLSVPGRFLRVFSALVVVGILYGCSLISYLLFHSIVETITIAVAFTLLILAWNTGPFLKGSCLKVLGLSYGAISLIDLLHMLSFKGMGIFPDGDANLPTQLWIAARYLQAVGVCVAVAFVSRTVGNRILVPVVLAVAAAPLVLIFTGLFPACYVEGQGLTLFKVASEYVICLLFLLAIVLFRVRRHDFDPKVYRFILASLAVTIVSELAFTSYVSVYAPANLVGHLLKLGAFYFLYRALIHIGFREPYNLIFRDLRESERNLGLTVAERTAQLRESESRFRSVFEHSPLGKALTSPDGRLIEVNQAFARMLGSTVEEMMNRRFAEFTHPDDRKTSADVVASILDGLQTSARLEKRYLHRDGRIVWAEVSTALLRDEGGRPVYFITSVSDISDRKALEADRERLQAQLTQAQKMEAVGLLAGGVAHDFNNMLGVILGRVQLARRVPELPKDLAGQLNEIEKAADQSAQLTRQLVAFARKQPIAPRIIDFNLVLGESMTLLRRIIRESVQVIWVPGASLPPVRMDPGQLEQVVANLCVNARDAVVGSGEGAGTIVVETRTAVVDEVFCRANDDSTPGVYDVLSVSDTGHGMTPEVRARIFEPFFTTKEMGHGTGLGLATVYGIARQNNGFLTVDSEPGKGATFQVYLPASVGTEPIAEPVLARADLRTRRGRVLLVEDEPMLLEVISIMLENLGFTVLRAPGPEAALRLVAAGQTSIDLLISDVIMPGMNGRDLALGLLNQLPDLKVLFLSGYTASVVSSQDERTIPGGFLQKPFTQDELAGKLDLVLGHSERR